MHDDAGGVVTEGELRVVGEPCPKDASKEEPVRLLIAAQRGSDCAIFAPDSLGPSQPFRRVLVRPLCRRAQGG